MRSVRIGLRNACKDIQDQAAGRWRSAVSCIRSRVRGRDLFRSLARLPTALGIANQLQHLVSRWPETIRNEQFPIGRSGVYPLPRTIVRQAPIVPLLGYFPEELAVFIGLTVEVPLVSGVWNKRALDLPNDFWI